MLALCGSVSTTSVAPRVAYADFDPSGQDPPLPSPEPGAGDPDYPQGSGRMPKPGPGRGSMGQTYHGSSYAARLAGPNAWMWKLRVVYAAVYRTFFRF